MQVRAISGETIVELEKDELGLMLETGKSVRDLKEVLAAQTGYSRFRQRLLGEDTSELQDQMPLQALPSVQLVILDFCHCAHSEEELLLACEANRLPKVEELLQSPLDPNATSAGRIPVHAAAEKGHSDVVRLLLEAKAEPNASSPHGTNALHLATQNGHSEVVRWLLQAGADPNAAMDLDVTAVHMAALKGYPEVMSLLLGAGAEANVTMANGSAPLLLAAHSGNLELLRLLIDAQANTNYSVSNGLTGLHVAIQRGHLEQVRLLLKARAQATATLAGTTPVQMALESGFPDLVQLLRQEEGQTPADGKRRRVAANGMLLVEGCWE